MQNTASENTILSSKFAQLTSREIEMFQARALAQASCGWPMHSMNAVAQAQVKREAAKIAERMCAEYAMARSMMMGR